MTFFLPDVVWSAIIASLLTLFGVLLTHRHNSKQITNQLSHDAEQRDRERNMELRLRVYMEVVEAITANYMVLTKLSNLENHQSDISNMFSESSAIISQINLIGSNETIKAVSEFSSELTKRYLELLLKRFSVMNRKIDIDLLYEEMKKHLADHAHHVELMKELNLKGNYDERLWGVINENIEFAMSEYDKLSDKRNNLMKLNSDKLFNLSKECIQASRDLGDYIVPAISAIRKEIELPFDEQEFHEIMKRSWEEIEKPTNDFLNTLKNELDDTLQK